MRQTLIVLLGVACAACLPTPTPLGHDASPPDPGDASTKVAFSIHAVRVVAFDGTPFSLEDAPGWPRIHVETTRPPDAPLGGSDGVASVYLFIGADEEGDLERDLSDRPVLVSSRARSIEARIDLGPGGWILTPSAPLRRGAHSIGIAGWAASDGERVESAAVVPLWVSGSSARLLGAWPPDGATSVAPGLESVDLRFDGAVMGISDGIQLLEEGVTLGTNATRVPCTTAGWPDGHCVRLSLDRPIGAGLSYVLEVGAGLRDMTGAPVGPVTVEFTSGLDPNPPPPVFIQPACGLDETSLPGACLLADDDRVRLRLHLSEAVRLRWMIAGHTVIMVAPRGEADLVQADLVADADFDTIVHAEATGSSVSRMFQARTTPPLAAIEIAEVRSDPHGREPRQEYVEVLNSGAVSLDLQGMSLSDRSDTLGDVIESSVPLAPGQRVLLVADDFDPNDEEDDRVPAATALVRLGRSIASGGLTNAGEPLFLRDSDLHRLSAAPAMETGEGRCLTRGADDRFEITDCSPGRP